jgi:hypothetical protein
MFFLIVNGYICVYYIHITSICVYCTNCECVCVSPWFFETGSHSIAYPILKFMIFLPLPSECWDYSVHHTLSLRTNSLKAIQWV